jgi:hypothetical protein
MTGLGVPILVPPVVPPSLAGGVPSQRLRSGQPLPLAPLLSARAQSTVYGLAAVDDRGRIADHVVVDALDWRAGAALDVRVVGGVIFLTANDDGASRVTKHGHVRLPQFVRRRCGIESGDRVLLAAEPTEGVLTMHPLIVMDTMVTRFHAQVMAGDAT